MPGEEVRIEARDCSVLATISGEVDASNAQGIEGRLRSAMTAESSTLVIDFTATTFLDSAGIRMLFAVSNDLAAQGQEMRLVLAPTSLVHRVISITGFDQQVKIAETTDEALGSTS